MTSFWPLFATTQLLFSRLLHIFRVAGEVVHACVLAASATLSAIGSKTLNFRASVSHSDTKSVKVTTFQGSKFEVFSNGK